MPVNRGQPDPRASRERSARENRGGDRSGGRRKNGVAFTLIELLVVVAIIGILAAVSLPALKGLGRSNRFIAADRQLLDDLGLARLYALNNRSVVYMVFLPPLEQLQPRISTFSREEQEQFQNLISGQYLSYTFLARRSVGDQPGREHPKYLEEWRTLPEGMIFGTNQFQQWAGNRPGRGSGSGEVWPDLATRPFEYASVPFPFATSRVARLPAVAFNAEGRLLHPETLEPAVTDEIITYGEGNVLFPRDDNDDYVVQPATVVETPPGNSTNNKVRINWLTGRAEVERAETP